MSTAVWLAGVWLALAMVGGFALGRAAATATELELHRADVLGRWALVPVHATWVEGASPRPRPR